MIDVKIPSPGESITEVEIASWLVSDGDLVHQDQELAEVESDKATLMLSAPKAGKISIKIEAGKTATVGDVACQIDTSVEVPSSGGSSGEQPDETKMDTPAQKTEKERETPDNHKAEETSSSGQESRADSQAEKAGDNQKAVEDDGAYAHVKTTPLAREKMKAAGLSVQDVMAGLKKLSSSQVDAVLNMGSGAETGSSLEKTDRTQEKTPMSQLRKKLSRRLVKVKNETAMLTTFNEVDMQAVMHVRQKYQKAFVDKHGFKIGFMSFFMKASALVLKQRPMVNSMIDGEEIVTPRYVDISVAVQTPKGLMVPVVRDVDAIDLPTIEQRLNNLAGKARSGKISLEEMSGGTFTITNGGIFGSMLSTPLINPPQSAILGMHNIMERPVAINGKVEIRPMMYVALSYDHRLIDGKDSVGFLMDLKKLLEEPRSLLDGRADVMEQLLDI